MLCWAGWLLVWTCPTPLKDIHGQVFVQLPRPGHRLRFDAQQWHVDLPGIAGDVLPWKTQWIVEMYRNEPFSAASELRCKVVPTQLYCTPVSAGSEPVTDVLKSSQVLHVLKKLSKLSFANLILFCRVWDLPSFSCKKQLNSSYMNKGEENPQFILSSHMLSLSIFLQRQFSLLPT